VEKPTYRREPSGLAAVNPGTSPAGRLTGWPPPSFTNARPPPLITSTPLILLKPTYAPVFVADRPLPPAQDTLEVLLQTWAVVTTWLSDMPITYTPHFR